MARTPSKRNQLVEEHLALVERVAQQVQSKFASRVEMNDLISDGCWALIDAAERFDPREGARFETFAGHRILGEMMNGIRRRTTIGGRRVLSLDAPCGGGRRLTFAENLPNGRPGPDDTGDVRAIVMSLPADLRCVLLLRYDGGMTFAEIARTIGVSEGRARRMRREAIERLRLKAGRGAASNR